MPDTKQFREQRANRTGVFSGLGVYKNRMELIDDYAEREGIKPSFISGEDVARQTYGDKFDQYLTEAKENYIRHGNVIPSDLHTSIPSYNPKVWKTPIETYLVNNRIVRGKNVLGGLTGATRSGIPKIIAVKGADALDHENIHGLQFLSRNREHGIRNAEYREYPEPKKINPSGIFRPFNNKDLMFSASNLEAYQTGYRAAAEEPEETIAYLTEANREFYKKNKRRIETKEDLNQGLRLMEETGMSPYIEKGKTDALLDKASTLDLSKMLIKNEGKSKVKGVA